MRLLTHNQLVCVKKGCDNAFPLQLSLRQVEQNETEVNYDLVIHLLGRVDYDVLRSAATALNITNLPETLPPVPTVEEHEELLSTLHTLLLDVRIIYLRVPCSAWYFSLPLRLVSFFSFSFVFALFDPMFKPTSKSSRRLSSWSRTVTEVG